MIDLRPEDILHKSNLNRALIEIIDNPLLAHCLAFKGGTCAAMLGYLDRFSIDLDFDVLEGADESALRIEFHKIFDYLDLRVTGELDAVLFFQLHYPAQPGKRNTLKVSANSLLVRSNQYRVQYLAEIDRMVNCQTLETMFANKLVAITDRYHRRQAIAARDLYDIHYFLIQGYAYHAPVIQERTGLDPEVYFGELIEFIHRRVAQRVINEDLNTLLPPRKFQQVRKILITQTVTLLERERNRLKGLL